MMVMEEESGWAVAAKTLGGALLIGFGVGIGYHLGTAAYREMSDWWDKTPEERRAEANGKQ
jgi:hypothetical protein